ncbi:aminotransferase class I/II-fold pyridoxal phosphate-dependent enzyme [Paenibacillus sp. NEAU-GSW1]|nr:aminotransferase class I/II-fold pyridoxal phosphate-dependent enzyme [Paenibacillus sp. NEAU-GSW1]
MKIGFDNHSIASGKKTEALFQSLRELIVEGTLLNGERLPSSRKLAELLEISRGSVNQAYDMLLAEGFVRTGRGSGTYIAYQQPDYGLGRREAEGADIPLSSWAKRLQQAQSHRPSEAAIVIAADEVSAVGIDFSFDVIERPFFPYEEWKSAMFEEIRCSLDQPKKERPGTEGYYPLREAIAHELRRERGIIASAEHIFITNGSMHAIALLCMLLINYGDNVVVENPGYSGIRRAVEVAGGSLIYGNVDDSGIIPEQWEGAKLLFVTPSRQFPTGVTLTAERRKLLLEWASKRRAVIVEDDYDSEFRWGGRPAEPLKALDREGRVVFIGTFSKTMYTELRLGFAVVPEALREPMRLAKYLLEPHPSSIAEQRALAGFMASGQYLRHLRRQRRVYGRRLQRFREQAKQSLGGMFRFAPSDAGLHQYAEWLGQADEYETLKARCIQAGVKWTDGSRYWREPSKVGCLSAIFGFAHLSEEQITDGLKQIAACWEEMLAEKR